MLTPTWHLLREPTTQRTGSPAWGPWGEELTPHPAPLTEPLTLDQGRGMLILLGDAHPLVPRDSALMGNMHQAFQPGPHLAVPSAAATIAGNDGDQ